LFVETTSLHRQGENAALFATTFEQRFQIWVIPLNDLRASDIRDLCFLISEGVPGQPLGEWSMALPLTVEISLHLSSRVGKRRTYG
jgi:hypothetical protein